MDPSEGTVLFMVLSIAISSHKFLPITSVGDKIDIAAIPWRETKVLGEEIHSHKIKIVHLGHTWPVFPTRPSEFQKDQGLHTHEARSGDVAKSLVVRPKPFSYYGYSLAAPQFLKKAVFEADYDATSRFLAEIFILTGQTIVNWLDDGRLGLVSSWSYHNASCRPKTNYPGDMICAIIIDIVQFQLQIKKWCSPKKLIHWTCLWQSSLLITSSFTHVQANRVHQVMICHHSCIWRRETAHCSPDRFFTKKMITICLRLLFQMVISKYSWI